MTDVAVITGDLIASTEAPGRVDGAMSALATAAAQISGWTGHSTRFTRFRGDGWQMLLVHPALALRAALLIAARLRMADTGLSTRLAIGLGQVDSLGRADLSDASGPALTLSGRALDHMPRSQRWVMAGDLPPWQPALLTLAEWHASRWSREQAEAVAALLPPDTPTQATVAADLGITRQALQARLSGAGLAAWRPALAAYEGAKT